MLSARIVMMISSSRLRDQRHAALRGPGRSAAAHVCTPPRAMTWTDSLHGRWWPAGRAGRYSGFMNVMTTRTALMLAQSVPEAASTSQVS